MEALESRGAYLRVLGDPIDTATLQGRFMLQMLGALAELERSTIWDRVMSGPARAARLGRRSGNPRMIQRDGAALAQLQAARHGAYLEQLTTGLDRWLPHMVRMREAGESWAAVTATLNARRAYADTTPWTTARLTRAAKALVREHLAPASILTRGTRRSSPQQVPRDRAVTAVAAILNETPGTSLRGVAAKLTALRIEPPRGRTWHPSSVARLIAEAEQTSLLTRRLGASGPSS